jgi:hypothetical protein
MSLKNLPPVWESWNMKDLEGLSKEEIERLQVLLKTKINFVSDQYERYLFFTDKERYIQKKAVELRASKGMTSTKFHDLVTMS